MCLPSRAAGYTLFELIITIAIVSVIATIAIPSFRTILLNNQRAAIGNEFLVSNNYARSEALNQRGRVVVCRTATPDATTPVCGTGTGYESGWVVYKENSDPADTVIDLTNAVVARRDVVLRRSQPLPTGTTLRGNTNVANAISYNSLGALASTSNGTLVLCDSRGFAESRVFVLSMGGRMRGMTSTDAANPATSCTPS